MLKAPVRIAIALLFFISGTSEVSAQIRLSPDTTTLDTSFLHHLKKPEAPFHIGSIVVPVTLMTYGIVTRESAALQQFDHSTKGEIREDHSAFVTHIDNYLQFSPGLAVYALNMAGVKGKNNFRDRSMIYGLTTMLSTAVIFPVKKLTHVERPDHSGFNSFPSGHTTMAFASAEFLRQEYKDVSPWYGVAGYAVAAFTGGLRMYNNKHWLSDVVAGAGLGILSTKTVYWVYPWIKKKLFREKPVSTMIMPYYQNGGGGLSLVHSFQ